jgi:hypothetical protein
MAFINFAKGRTPGITDETYLYFLAVMLAPEDFEALEGLQRGDIEWRFLALVNTRTRAPSPIAFSSMERVMQFTKVGGGAGDLPASTEIIRTEVDILRAGPCPHEIWLDPTVEAYRALRESGAYALSDEGLESLL